MSKHIKISYASKNRVILCPENFEKLQAAFSESFGIALDQLKQGTLNYKDNEGDLVSMKSEEDYKFFTSVVSAKEGPPLKVIFGNDGNPATLSQFSNNPYPNESNYQPLSMMPMQRPNEFIPPKVNQSNMNEGKYVHRGVACDGCGMNPIVGIRYKCYVCPNFDFCEKCEAEKGNEHGHSFIKLKTSGHTEMYNQNMANTYAPGMEGYEQGQDWGHWPGWGNWGNWGQWGQWPGWGYGHHRHRNQGEGEEKPEGQEGQQGQSQEIPHGFGRPHGWRGHGKGKGHHGGFGGFPGFGHWGMQGNQMSEDAKFLYAECDESQLNIKATEREMSTRIQLKNTGNADWPSPLSFACSYEYSEVYGNDVAIQSVVKRGENVNVEIKFDLSQVQEKRVFISCWQLLDSEKKPIGMPFQFSIDCSELN